MEVRQAISTCLHKYTTSTLEGTYRVVVGVQGVHQGFDMSVLYNPVLDVPAEITSQNPRV